MMVGEVVEMAKMAVAVAVAAVTVALALAAIATVVGTVIAASAVLHLNP